MEPCVQSAVDGDVKGVLNMPSVLWGLQGWGYLGISGVLKYAVGFAGIGMSGVC